VPNCEICGKMFEPSFAAGNISGGGTAFKCPECAAKNLASTPSPRSDRRREAAEFNAELNRIAPAQPVVTYALIAICTAVFVVELVKGAGFDSMSTDLAIRLGANYGPLTLSGQWWRLFTSMFLHFGVIHIFMNMWCLLFLGSLAERLMGRAAFLVLYVATGLFGSLLSVAIHPQEVAAGASGAVFGVTGGLITYLALRKSPLNFARAKNQLGRLALFVGINFFYSLGPGIDMMAHLGGLVSGLIIAAALPRFLQSPDSQTIPSPFQEKSNVNARVAAVAFVCAIAIVGGAYAAARSQGDSAFVLESLDQIDAGHSADVIPRLQQIVAKQPDDAMAHFALGVADMRTNNIGAAILELNKADTLAPGTDKTEQFLGAAYLMQGSFDPAVTKFQQVLADQPDNLIARLGLAGGYLGQNQYQQAVTESKKVLAAQPKNSQAHAVLGQAEIELGTTDDGLHEMETALQLAPNNADLRANLLADYKAAGRIAQYQALLSQSAAPDKSATPAPPAKSPARSH
jgi:membrane associated rhomboid family serine protease/Flp pilus assembly protein TadD